MHLGWSELIFNIASEALMGDVMLLVKNKIADIGGEFGGMRHPGSVNQHRNNCNFSLKSRSNLVPYEVPFTRCTPHLKEWQPALTDYA